MTKHKKKRSKKRFKLPISAARVKALAFGHELLIDAAAAVDIEPSLTELIEKYPQLSAAWDRGQFLRRLFTSANSILAPSQIAKELGIEHEKLEEMRKTDRETRQLWIEARFQLCIRLKKMIEKAAKQGKLHAVTRIENLLRAELESQGNAISRFDIEHVPIQVTANLIGVTRQTLHKYHREDGLSRNTDETYNLKVVIPFILHYNEAKLLSKGVPIYVDPLRQERSLEIKQRRLQEEGFLQNTQEIAKGLLAREQAFLDSQKHYIEELASRLEGMNYQQRIEQIQNFFDTQRKERIRLSPQLSLPEGGTKKLEELLGMLEPNPRIDAD